MNRRALEGYEKALGKEHEYTLISMGRMAEVLRHQGRDRIRMILTPEQKPKFEAFMQHLDEERKKSEGEQH